MATVNEQGDVIVAVGTLNFKVRSDEIVIRNQDPLNKRVDIYESVRRVKDDGKMGVPMVNRVHSVPVLTDGVPNAEFLTTEIDGITGAQVLAFIALWAALINAEHADSMVGQAMG